MLLPAKAADAVWGGNDSPGEWLFYMSAASACMLPFTGAVGWLIYRPPQARHFGAGLLVGLALSLLLAATAVVAGYAPPWVNDDPV
ncbi:hypothetical protein AB0M47_29185 [Hamadaea sp. NPDC051192]|uniref:hypothetical protein n=1 Tax=Hamadaea sp. NPDC051192 TaxID=3154940 RepID=UPI00342E62A6